jgi:hypothetical protein
MQAVVEADSAFSTLIPLLSADDVKAGVDQDDH